MHLQPNDLIGEYRIIDLIGNGGFSVVYKAEDLNLERPVAVKQLSPEVFSEAGTREWFIREARLAASLNHPNIVSTYALREQGDMLFIIMEYMDGGDLHSLIAQNGSLDRTTLLKVAVDMCSALETLHARNVIHRDIKPENIMIAQEGQFKLGDFGLAHIRQSYAHSLNRTTGPQPGTLLYMSPEQALGEEITVQSDIYSLAIALYEAITGHYYLDYDFRSDDEDLLLDMIVQAPPLPITVRDSSVPEELDEPILRALSKNPEDRPKNARQFLSEIKNAFSRAKRSTLSQKRRLLTSQAAPTPPELWHDLYAVRTLRDADHQPQKAQDRLQVLWQQYSGLPEVAAEWGETQIALGQIDEGRNWLERAVRLKPDIPFAQLALADLYRDVDENDADADSATVEAIHADADLAYAVLYDDIVASLDDPVQYEHFVEIFHRAAQERPSAAVYHNLGQVLALHKKRKSESILCFETALDLDADYGPAYVGLGTLLTEQDQLDEAIGTLEQGTYRFYPPLPPEDWHKSNTVYQRAHAFLALAVAYAQAEQFENSAIAAFTALDLDPSELEDNAEDLLSAYAQAADEWMTAGEYLRAYKFLNQCIPLAAHWGYVRIFMLLAVAQQKIDASQQRKEQWEDATDWLRASALHLNRKSHKRA